MSGIDDLIARLERATGPDYKLDHEIFAHDRGWSYPLVGAALQEFDELTREHGRTNYTKSINAALTLVPEGLNGSIAFGKHSGAILWERDPRKHLGEHRGKTPALALCIACLRARQHD